MSLRKISRKCGKTWKENQRVMRIKHIGMMKGFWRSEKTFKVMMVISRERNKLKRVVKKAGNLEKCFLVKKLMRMN
jgi:hypothetical protein